MGKKTRYTRAVALAYDSKKDDAPLVTVKGRHLRADEIVKIARRYGVPVVEQPALAAELEQVDSGRIIPEDLFEAVALLLHQLGESLSKGKKALGQRLK